MAEQLAVAEEYVEQEEYAQSLTVLRHLGSVAANKQVSLETIEALEELAFDDFSFGVAEMMATDPEFREFLDVDPTKTHRVVNGKVQSAYGEDMVDVITRGRKKSEAAARNNPNLKFQVERDKGDELNALRVDDLPIGWTRLVASMDPKEALRDYPKEAKSLGYKEGMMYWQVYTRTDKETLETSSHSVDMSNTLIWSALIKDFFGADIPSTIPTSDWIKHGIEIESSAEEAEQLFVALRREYYKRLGVAVDRKSVSEYLEQNRHKVKLIFETYYPSLSEAISSKNNNEAMSSLATSILGKSVANKLKPEVRQQLLLIANANKFTSEMGRTMNSIIRYVTVEELRKDLPTFLHQSVSKQTPADTSDAWLRPEIFTYEMINQLMASNLSSGVEAHRSYGGCAGQIELGMDGLEGGNSKQEAFGGSCPEVKDGQLTKCPHCKQMVKAIVPDRKTIYCSNEKCKLASPKLSQKLAS